ncbi:putative mediator of RNA polymerase II transcription subunit 1 [[Candida] railenensis]|uniref:Mediator of RNA polymerase II transcription subunit 1 n=1 Tax=[Candida] railenensis TaxID=45579 RepID=A0A9P0VWV4_9ASCO|nr:putative mediator of RNA polymerase II transcription subunit 1 [[Candida] railenensis]
MAVSFNENISQSLELLYNHSSTFNLSIDLIQKLAQQLKLDTFKDKDAYTHVTTTSSDSNFKRLSIAGSLILIDIDFLDDDTILKVSVSSANHPDDGSESKVSPILSKEIVEGNTYLVKLNSKSNNLSFIGRSAEHILLQNLKYKSKKLNQFPANLRYLSSLDRLSLPQLDLFVYLDKIIKLLHSINEIEAVSDQWELPCVSSIGEVLANDADTGKLGVFLKIWQDYRFINHEAGKDICGKQYKLLFRVSNLKEGSEALGGNVLKESWELQGNQYSFIFDEDKAPTSASSNTSTSSSSASASSVAPSSLANKFLLSLDFNNSIIIPKSVLQYLDLYSFGETAFGEDDAAFLSLTKYKDISFSSDSKVILIKQDFPNEYISVNSVSIRTLNSILRVVPVLRNFSVLHNLVNSLAKKCASQFESYSIENEIEQANKKALKETLNLPGGIGSDELLGLSLSAENPILSSIQSIKPNEVDLDTFMEGEDQTITEQSEPEEELAKAFKTVVQLSIEDIDLTSPHLDVILGVFANVENESGKSVEIDVKFKISNGQIKSIGEDIDMTSDNSSERFIKALNLTEDVPECIKHVYLK